MLPLATDNNALMLLFVLALGVMVATLLMRWNRYFKRRRREEAREGRADSSPQAYPAIAPPELDQWQVQMYETARELMGQLDSKMSALAALTAEADRAAGRLEAALSQTSEPQSAPAEAPRVSAESRHDEIAMLANYGYDAAEIARRIGAPIGEVELILRLGHQRPGEDAASAGETDP